MSAGEVTVTVTVTARSGERACELDFPPTHHPEACPPYTLSPLPLRRSIRHVDVFPVDVPAGPVCEPADCAVWTVYDG